MSASNAYEKVNDAARAHTNLNTFGAIVAILEGGCVYGGGTEATTARKIIALCRAEQARQLARFDKAAGRAQWLKSRAKATTGTSQENQHHG